MDKSKIEIKGNQIIIKDYYEKQTHLQTNMDYGLYKLFGTDSVPNNYKSPGAQSGNRMNWAYNNPYQPHTDTDRRRPIKMSYIDGSGANWPSVIGSMKEIWKEFEDVEGLYQFDFDDLDVRQLENNWWNYFSALYMDNFEKGVRKLEKYIAAKRKLFTSSERAYEERIAPEFTEDYIWYIGCRDYMQYLVRTSARGFTMELILFQALREMIGGDIIESTKQEEQQGIDGYIKKGELKYPICLKPDTFHGGVSPLCQERMVFYNNKPAKNNNDLIFTFKTGADVLRLAK